MSHWGQYVDIEEKNGPRVLIKRSANEFTVVTISPDYRNVGVGIASECEPYSWIQRVCTRAYGALEELYTKCLRIVDTPSQHPP